MEIECLPLVIRERNGSSLVKGRLNQERAMIAAVEGAIKSSGVKGGETVAVANVVALISAEPFGAYVDITAINGEIVEKKLVYPTPKRK